MLLVIVKANLYGDNSFTTNGNFLVSNYGVKYNLLLTVNNIEILFKFKVESISGIVENNTGALSARAVFANPNGVLLSGSTGRLIVAEEHEQAIVIPQTATYEILNKIYVYKVVQGLAQSAIIEVAPASDGLNYVVTEGLSEGDVIVAEGAGYVREGMEINIDKQTEQ